MSNASCPTTAKCDLRPDSRHLSECGDNLEKRNARNTAAASDWRAEAEAHGRAAYEAAVAEPQTIAEPLAWLWGAAAATKEWRRCVRAPNKAPRRRESGRAKTQ